MVDPDGFGEGIGLPGYGSLNDNFNFIVGPLLIIEIEVEITVKLLTDDHFVLRFKNCRERKKTK